MVDWYVAVKLTEWLIWWGIGLTYLIKGINSKARLSWIYLSLAAAFFVFGAADFIEYFTKGHFPWWLWVWKIVGGLVLFGLLVVNDYYKRGVAALSPWRFLAALVILVMAIECWRKSISP
jgi:hypothetical protein